MDTDKTMMSCELCGKEFQYGPHRYDGQFIRRYQLTVCKTCFSGNRDGWAPHLEEKFLAHLKAKHIPAPARNAEGWFPRD